MAAIKTNIKQVVLALRQCLGEEHVVCEADSLEKVSRTSVPNRHLPEIVVYPSSPDEVQVTLVEANKHQLPVWPVSKGKNWGYGSKSACYTGGITMILEICAKYTRLMRSWDMLSLNLA